MNPRRFLLLAVLLSAAVTAPAQFNLNKLTKALEKTKEITDVAKDASKVAKGAAGIGPEEEKMIGESVALEVIALYGGVLRDEAATRRVNLVGRTLARYSERPDLDWRFAVLNSPKINAFSAPGGYVFITRGLYDQANSDDLLAGILGHEIGHITGKHALNIIRRDELMAGGSSLLTRYSGDYREAKASTAQIDAQLRQFDTGIGKITKGLLEKGFDAPTEFNADQTGHDLAATTGYAPGGLRAVLAHLQKTDSKAKATFSSHPPLADRLARLPNDPPPPVEAAPAAPAAAPAQKPAGQKQALAELLPKLTPGAPVEVGRVNGQQVRLQTFNGASAWLRADAGDVLLQVVRGSVMVEFRSGPVALGTGELLTIPRGTEYRTLADANAAALVVSP